jgi:hypothetical protein
VQNYAAGCESEARVDEANIASQWRVLSERFSTDMAMEWYLNGRLRPTVGYTTPTTSDTNTGMEAEGIYAYMEGCVILVTLMHALRA